MTKEYIISSGLLELYALGQTTENEASQVLQAFINWPDVKDEVLSMEKTMEAYAIINAVPAKDEVKNKLFETLKISISTAEKKNRAPIIHKNYSNFKLVKNIAAAAVVLLFGSIALNFVNYNKYKTALSKLSETEQKNISLNSKAEETVSHLNVVQSKFTLPLKLKPAVAPKDADAKIYWLTNSGEVYIDPTNLPATPIGKQYQLWAIVDGKAIDAGLIVPSNDKKLHFQKMKTFGKAQAFAVTLEIAGGVEASKEKPYVIVSL